LNAVALHTHSLPPPRRPHKGSCRTRKEESAKSKRTAVPYAHGKPKNRTC